MKTLFLTLAAFLSFSTVSIAQTELESAMISESSIANLPRVKGLIRGVDLVNSKLKIKHERIPNLGMPAMTMSFSVRSKSMLNGLKTNDKVLFSAEMIQDVLTVVWIQKQN